MAVDKLVDSTQLDADLSSVANAIRTKGGTSAQLAFPSGFVSAIGNIQTGGDTYEVARNLIKNNVTDYTDPDATSIAAFAFYQRSNLQTLHLPKVAWGSFNSALGGTNADNAPKVEALALPKYVLYSYSGYSMQSNINLKKLDVTKFQVIPQGCWDKCGKLNVIVLRNTSVVPLSNVNAFSATPFRSGGTGGTIYIPKSLYDHLGDGTSSDYQNATNWSTVHGYGTITWKSIESTATDPNEPIDLTTHYIDGTEIPTT